jgi:peptidoglycan/LPS O-acetylase OafA/YrhL
MTKVQAQINSTSIDQTQPHYQELDSLRGIAAMIVVLFHIPWNQSIAVPLIKNGHLMVDLFFILSGFVIYSAYASRINNIKDFIQFQFLRWGRIYPVHAIFLLLFMSNEIIRSLGGLTGLFAIGKPAFSNFDYISIGQQLTLTHAIGPTGNKLEFNAPSWSISVEFYTYLLFAVVIYLARFFSLPIFGIILLSSISIIWSGNSGEYIELLRCFSGFFTGCLLAYVAKKNSRKYNRHIFSLAFVFLIAVLCLDLEAFSSLIILVPSALLVFFAATAEKSILNTLLLKRIPVWLGKISYSMYMCHWYVIWILGMVFKRVFEKPETVGSNGYSSVTLNSIESIIALILTVFLTLFLAHFTYKYIENPARLWSRSFVKRFQ